VLLFAATDLLLRAALWIVPRRRVIGGVHRSKSGAVMSASGHKRQMQCEPTGGLFPLLPKTGNVNAQQQNAA